MKFLFLILFFLYSFPSLSNPNGKGVICYDEIINQNVQDSPRYWFLFENNKVIEYIPTKSSVKKKYPDKLSYSSVFIEWEYLASNAFHKEDYPSERFTLDRTNLKLELKSFKNSFYELAYKKQFNCKVFLKDNFLNKVVLTHKKKKKIREEILHELRKKQKI